MPDSKRCRKREVLATESRVARAESLSEPEDPELGWSFEASEPDLAYILVEILIFESERVAIAFRAWTLLNPL